MGKKAENTKKDGKPKKGKAAEPAKSTQDEKPAARLAAMQQKVGNQAVQAMVAQQKGGGKEKNTTGLPDQIKSGLEQMSGLDLSDVRVHYNSPKPAEVGAHAYAQGTDIHLAPGQEKHLSHEAAHVVQQMQGRVKPTTQAKGIPVNDDSGLEKEADQMGQKAAQKMTADQAVQREEEEEMQMQEEEELQMVEEEEMQMQEEEELQMVEEEEPLQGAGMDEEEKMQG